MRVFVVDGDHPWNVWLLEALLLAGYRVTVLCTKSYRAWQWWQLGVDDVVLVRHVLQTDWLPCLKGHHAVIYAPALPPAPSHPGFSPLRLLPTLWDACRRYGVAHFVLISSDAVHWGAEVTSLYDVDETIPFSRHPWEKRVRRWQWAEVYTRRRMGSMHVTVLRFPVWWGPAWWLLEPLLFVPLYYPLGPRGLPIEAVHVENVIHAVLRALESPMPWRVCFVTDAAPYTLKVFAERLGMAVGLPHPVDAETVRLWKSKGRFCASKPHKFWCQGPFRPYHWAFLTRPRRYRLRNARHLLDYTPVLEPEEGFHQLRRWSEQRLGWVHQGIPLLNVCLDTLAL